MRASAPSMIGTLDMQKRPSIPVYAGPWGPRQAERLLWRAGFGPRPGDVERLVRAGRTGAVRSLTRPKGAARLTGPAPTDDRGRPIAPFDAWGHDHLWWLDRMVRSDQPLVERMVLVWHDWFATSKEGGADQRRMLTQNATIRRHALGDFDALVHAMTVDPAMLLWLSGTNNSRDNPNENYAREMMELFCLGAGRGYTERDVREQARALTGWRNDWGPTGAVRFRYDPAAHDDGVKRVFGRRGRYGVADAVDLCLRHRLHPGYLVDRLWGYFIPVRCPAATRAALIGRYRRSGHRVRPLLEAILLHPLLYTGPSMTKPPVVYVAGMLRGTGQGVTTDAWTWICEMCGQTLFVPPSVAGWDDARWMDTATWRGRWIAAGYAVGERNVIDVDTGIAPASAVEAVAEAIRFWNHPTVGATTLAGLTEYAQEVASSSSGPWEDEQYARLRQNALRVLVATSPDYQTC